MTRNDKPVAVSAWARPFSRRRMTALLCAGACAAATALPAHARPIGGGRAVPYPYVSQCPNAPAPGAVGRYVSTTGSDSNNGLTLASAFRSVTKGLQMARPGDVVYVASGVYREQVDMYTGGGQPGKPVTLRNISAWPVITGSDPVSPSGWTLLRGAIYAHPWPSNSQQVFVDGLPLAQMGNTGYVHHPDQYTVQGSGLADLDRRAGAFWYDKNASVLYVRLANNSSPAAHVVEASTRRRALFLDRTRTPYVCIEAMIFRHSNQTADAEQGPGVALSNGSVLANSLVEYMDFMGVDVGGDGARVAYSTVRRNGAVGLTSSGKKGVIIERNQVVENNYRGFIVDWISGGMKFDSHFSGMVRDNAVARNTGPGIWFDGCQIGGPITVWANYVHDNRPGESAILIEVSSNALVANNLVVANAKRGIYLSASTHSRVLFNTILRSNARAGLEIGGTPRGALTVNDNEARGNIIAFTFKASTDPNAVYDLDVSRDSAAFNNSSNDNLFFRRGASLLFSSTFEFTTLDAWRSGTGWDLQSQSADPLFTDEARNDFTLTAGSPARGKVNSIAAVPTDHDGVPRPPGGKSDQGAFQFQ